MEKDNPATTNHRITRVATSISDKVGFRPNATRYKEGHFIMTKVTIPQENIIILNVYVDNKTSKQKKKTELRYTQVHNYSWLLHRNTLGNLQNRWREGGFKNREGLNSTYPCDLPNWYL